MSFYDRLTIDIRAGRGGDGSFTFRREAHVPRGGADGGDGGDGGDVLFAVDPSRRDLAHLRRHRRYSAGDGEPGARRRRHGARGADVVIAVPRGAQVFTEDGRKLCDLVAFEERAIVARGGQGGRGNTHFVSSVRRAPSFAEVGLPGEELTVELRLKLMADAALVGLPNAGKSSLLRRISNAKPKVGDYPFTTVQPVLGTIDRPDGSQVVVIDVPGLVEGASEGVGMGHAFLAHLERAHVLVHMVSLEDVGRVADSIATIMGELWAYDPRVAMLPQILVLSKRDLVDDAEVGRASAVARSAIDGLGERVGEIVAIHAVSSATSQGVTAFVQTLFRASAATGDDESGRARADRPSLPLDDYRVYRPRPRRRRWRIYRDAHEGLRVNGDETLQRLARSAADGDHDALAELEEWLASQGALHALAMAGAGAGHRVNVCGTPVDL